MSSPALGRRAAPASIALLLLVLAPAVHAATMRFATPGNRPQADALVRAGSSPARDRALSAWARKAPANDVVWVLRHSSQEMGTAELPVLEAALAALPAARSELRQRWLARQAAIAPRMLRRGQPLLPDLRGLRPYASVFRVAVLLPDDGEYAGYGYMLRAAIADGLAFGRSASAPSIAIDSLGTGDSDGERVASAFEKAAAASDIMVGELLSAPTRALATAARSSGIVLISPTATDERIGAIGPRVFQIGPGTEARARALADAVLGREAHTLAIAGNAAGIRGAFANAFVREAEARGGKVVRRNVAAADAGSAANLAASLKASGADVVFWDGGTREAEALVRALAANGASLRLCGGPNLAPEGFRSSARPLLEGVTWVEDMWRASDPVRSRLDSLATRTGTRAGSLWLRGWLVGRRIAGAIDEGARTSGEVAAALRARDSTMAANGYLDLTREGVTLPVYTVRSGRAVVAERTSGE